MNFKQKLQRLFGLKKQKPSSSESMMQSGKSEMMQKMLTMLSKTQEVEMTCDDVFAVLDQFAEMAARGEDVSKLMPLVKHHIDMCADCLEEYRVLESIVLNAA